MAYLDDDGEILCAVCEQRPATGAVCMGEDDAPDYREVWHCEYCWEHRHGDLHDLLTRGKKWYKPQFRTAQP